jgi:hypothetical protein
MKQPVESTADFKLRIAAMLRDKPEHISGAQPPNPMLVRKKRATLRKRRRH